MPISPVAACASDIFSITDTLSAGSTITAMSVKIYLGSTDKTTALMTTGSESYSANVYTTKYISGMQGGNEYVLAAAITIDGVKTTRKCKIRVQKDSEAV
jgi:hypothetical protein